MANRSLLAVAVLALAAAAIWFGLQRRREPAPISGTIEVDEVHVASRYGGRVEKINVQEGASLHSGDVIVELEAGELRARRDFAAAQLAELEQGPRAAEIEAARQDWESQKAQLEFARADAKRARELLAQKTVSQTEGERAVSTAAAMEKSVEAARQRYELLQQGTRPERVTQARAQLAEIDAQLREMKIVAPSDCVVEVLSVKVGDVLPANRELATLILPQHLWVRVYVPESWLGYIAVGDKVSLRVDSFRDEKFSGDVEQINRSAEFTPRNVQTVEERIKQVFGVKIRLENSSGRLRAGMSADVWFPRLPK
ncbi:MAG: HlyD family efflux transporter periplasmic adaptor subunit [Verrucomicrobiota bacterium]|nr:HlyD family efflux transporter periplasmic adaptor subunit [Verrucomicrobiota bacterium]